MDAEISLTTLEQRSPTENTSLLTKHREQLELAGGSVSLQRQLKSEKDDVVLNIDHGLQTTRTMETPEERRLICSNVELAYPRVIASVYSIHLACVFCFDNNKLLT